MSRIDDTRDAVIDNLTFDPDVDASAITVEYTDGEVVLTGSVPSYPDYLEAARGGASRRQVRCVRNHLQITLPPGDYRDDRALTAVDDRGGSVEGIHDRFDEDQGVVRLG
jgi:hypothetical protein